MKAHVEQDFLTRRVRIWIYQPSLDTRETHFLEPDLDTMTPVSQGAAKPEPTMDLHWQVAEAIASALASMGRPEEATSRHLDDALKVRDRLLSMVEKHAGAA